MSNRVIFLNMKSFNIPFKPNRFQKQQQQQLFEFDFS